MVGFQKMTKLKSTTEGEYDSQEQLLCNVYRISKTRNNEVPEVFNFIDSFSLFKEHG